MKQTILITGGAGFVGSHLADELVRNGYHVRVLDSLSSQVHGKRCNRPMLLQDDIEFIRADIRNYSSIKAALKNVDAIFHFAAAVGVGQSMYEIQHYTAVNAQGTAAMLEAILEVRPSKLIVASSMSIYGEGSYCNADGQLVENASRTNRQLRDKQWDLLDANGEPLVPVPTSESKNPKLSSVYAITKYIQERMCMTVGQAYGIETVGLRFFNIYGPRQSLSNPYTGVLAIFASRLLNERRPIILEDGLQLRDFVHVKDIVSACRLALETTGVGGEVFNIGSGVAHSVREIAELMSIALEKQHIDPEIVGAYRAGDIRNCFADISLARRILGYRPKISLREGLIELAEWVKRQTAVDLVDYANQKLVKRGLVA